MFKITSIKMNAADADTLIVKGMLEQAKVEVTIPWEEREGSDVMVDGKPLDDLDLELEIDKQARKAAYQWLVVNKFVEPEPGVDTL